jgi:phasin family protein
LCGAQYLVHCTIVLNQFEKATHMTKGFEEIGVLGKEAFDTNLKALSAVSQSAQAIAVETGEFAKKSVEDAATNWKSLVSATSVENAIQIQTAYVKSTYEQFVAEASKLTSLYADLAKDAYTPFEHAFAKVR